jgi:SP family arabinose:H+ symporter-like MFS transporter
MRLALLIGIVLPFFSQISGVNVIVYYGPTVLKTVGVTINAALLWQILFGTVCSLATLAAILMVDKVGRKPLLLCGIAGVGLMLAASGILMGIEHVAPIWLVMIFAIFLGCFNLSYGAVCWVIVSEIFPTAIRGRAMSISIFSLWTGCALVTQTFPPLLKHLGPSATFWLYALSTPVAFLFVLLFVPETKGRSLEEIERRFAH